MSSPKINVDSPAARDANWSWAVGVSTVLILVRLAAIRLSPLQLYADEAQYWVWSRHLDFGYFTKPPLIAWLIWAHDAGQATPSRSCGCRRRCCTARPGCSCSAPPGGSTTPASRLASLLIYALMPAVQLGAFVVSTDTPLVACLAGALWAYAAMQAARRAERRAGAPRSDSGSALGLAFLAKYAALYAVVGIAAHLILSPAGPQGLDLAGDPGRGRRLRPARRAEPGLERRSPPRLVRPPAAGGGLGRAQGRDRRGAVVPGQPVRRIRPDPVRGAGRRRGLAAPCADACEAPDVLLLCWAAPALLIVLVQAFVAGAKANWAVAAFVPGSILVAAWMLRWGRQRTLVLRAGGARPGGAGRPRRRHRAAARRPCRAVQRAEGRARRPRGDRADRRRGAGAAAAGPLTAVAIDERELFNTVAYYGRDYFGHDGPPLKAWLAGPYPQNQAELAAPLTPADGAGCWPSAAKARITPMRAQFQQRRRNRTGHRLARPPTPVVAADVRRPGVCWGEAVKSVGPRTSRTTRTPIQCHPGEPR